MSKSPAEKTIEIIRSTEEVADKVLMSQQELVELDKRRQHNREAIRELVKNVKDKKVYITIGSMLVKMDREKSIKLLKEDQTKIEREYNQIKSEQKVLVNKQRDLEYLSPYSGTNLKSLHPREVSALKAALPIL